MRLERREAWLLTSSHTTRRSSVFTPSQTKLVFSSSVCMMVRRPELRAWRGGGPENREGYSDIKMLAQG